MDEKSLREKLFCTWFTLDILTPDKHNVLPTVVNKTEKGVCRTEGYLMIENYNSHVCTHRTVFHLKRFCGQKQKQQLPLNKKNNTSYCTRVL